MLIYRLRINICLRLLRRNLPRRMERGTDPAIRQEQYVPYPLVFASSIISSILPRSNHPLTTSPRISHVTRRLLRRLYPDVRHHEGQGRAAFHPWERASAILGRQGGDGCGGCGVECGRYGYRIGEISGRSVCIVMIDYLRCLQVPRLCVHELQVTQKSTSTSNGDWHTSTKITQRSIPEAPLRTTTG